MMDSKLISKFSVNQETVESPPASQHAEASSRVSIFVFGRDDVHVAHLGDGDSIVVGRLAPAELVVNDASLSRRHARFTRRGDVITVEDLGSRNGTWLDGKRIETARLSSGASLLIGQAPASVHVASVISATLAGIESHDRFLARIDEELVRSRNFRRSFAVFMLRTRSQQTPSLSTLCQELRGSLRPVDVIGTYGRGTVLVLAPELDMTAARDLGLQLSATAADGSERVLGVATFPKCATSAQELVAEATRACLRATKARPVVCSDSLAEPEPKAPGANPVEGIYSSPRMQEIRALLQRLAERKLPVLVLGETGTGKELAARELHYASARRDLPFLVVNCAAIPENLIESVLFGHERGAFTGADRARAGVFEDARGGTVFLDEVGELSRAAQAALLRVLETHKITRVGATRELVVDVRVVAATHRNLEKMAEQGEFRLDLLHRLNVVSVELPALRQRCEDIPTLVNYFLAQTNDEWGGTARTIDANALALLQQYAWPGNIRELRNVIARAVAITDGERITIRELPERMTSSATETSMVQRPELGKMDLRAHLRQVERDLILGALERSLGNQREAAALLGLPLRTFERRLAALKEDDGPAGDE